MTKTERGTRLAVVAHTYYISLSLHSFLTELTGQTRLVRLTGL